MKAEFDDKGMLVITAENNTEVYALSALGDKLIEKKVDTSWVVLVHKPLIRINWEEGVVQHPKPPGIGIVQLCKEEQKKQGGAYARSCKRCGKGPCHNAGIRAPCEL